MKTLTLILALALAGCSGRLGGDDDPNTATAARARGLNLWQNGLVNVHSGNTYNFPQPPPDRITLDQRLRLVR